MTQFRHSFSVLTTNFELEPVLEDYLKKYPNGPLESYEIVFRTEDEHAEGEYSYIVVFTLNRGSRESGVSFYDFLKSYCIYNNCKATLNPNNHILPQIGGQGKKLGPPILSK